MGCRRILLPALLIVFASPACVESPSSPDPARTPALSSGAERSVILVNPQGRGQGIARTIQDGIAMVRPGGRVLILPGSYAEVLTIDKGIHLEAIGGESGPVIIATPGTPQVAVLVTATAPVSLRGLHLQFGGQHGIMGSGAVDLTLENLSVQAVNPPLGVSFLVAATNDARASGGRARLVVRGSTIDGAIGNIPPPFTQSFAVRVVGDVDALVEDNTLRRVGGACVFVSARGDFSGETNVDILRNGIDECYPLGRVASVLIGPAFPLPASPATAAGNVNILGNVFGNAEAACRPISAISYEYFTGRIERNTIVNVVQPCATATIRNVPSAIFVGSLLGFAPASPVIRYNDIVGNAFAGLHLAGNQTAPLDATCNWWGATSGPSGVGPGAGDAIALASGAATPVFAPFATAPIATSSEVCPD